MKENRFEFDLAHGNYLMDLRSGLTPKDLAQILNVSVDYVKMVEKGMRFPSIDYVLNLLDKLDKKHLTTEYIEERIEAVERMVLEDTLGKAPYGIKNEYHMNQYHQSKF